MTTPEVRARKSFMQTARDAWYRERRTSWIPHKIIRAAYVKWQVNRITEGAPVHPWNGKDTQYGYTKRYEAVKTSSPYEGTTYSLRRLYKWGFFGGTVIDVKDNHLVFPTETVDLGQTMRRRKFTQTPERVPAAI